MKKDRVKLIQFTVCAMSNDVCHPITHFLCDDVEESVGKNAYDVHVMT